MNVLRKTGFRFFRHYSCHDCVAPASPRVDRQLFSLSRGPRPRKLGSPSATARFARATASHSIDCPAQAVLGGVENVLVWVEEASRLGYSANRRELAWSGVSFVLGMDLKIVSLRHLLGWIISSFRSRQDLVLENLALRRQLLALHAQRPRTRLTALHKLFWVALRTFWSGWRKPLVLVTPRTVVNWHRAGFRLYWTWISRFRRVGGRKRVSKEVRALIFRIVAENPTWGAPRIYGELLKLGFEVSERSVS